MADGEVDVEKYMLEREWFPLKIGEGENSFGLKRPYPPVHRSLLEDGIDTEVVLSVLDTAVENTVEDLRKWIEDLSLVSDVKKYLDSDADNLDYDIEEGARECGPSEEGITVVDFPLSGYGRLSVSEEQFSTGPAASLTLKPTADAAHFVPPNIDIPEEVTEEYEMEIERETDNYTRFRSPGRVHPHNVSDSERVLYRNLLIELNNDKVREKYG
ncbi:MAG: hypothetical protein SVV03_01505 [Candidatus Nanohaloarchaea archaeon]|nr:hypothetical protein [Candidatus Nanohaloarchaea archaeon]